MQSTSRVEADAFWGRLAARCKAAGAPATPRDRKVHARPLLWRAVQHPRDHGSRRQWLSAADPRESFSALAPAQAARSQPDSLVFRDFPKMHCLVLRAAGPQPHRKCTVANTLFAHGRKQANGERALPFPGRGAA